MRVPVCGTRLQKSRQPKVKTIINVWVGFLDVAPLGTQSLFQNGDAQALCLGLPNHNFNLMPHWVSRYQKCLTENLSSKMPTL